MPSFGEVIHDTSNSAVELYNHHARQLGVEPSGYGQFLAAVFGACHVAAPHLQPDTQLERIPDLLHAAERAVPDLWVHPSSEKQVQSEMMEYPAAVLRCLHTLDQPERGEGKLRAAQQELSELYQRALLHSFGGSEPPDIPAFLEQVTDAMTRYQTIWLRVREGSKAARSTQIPSPDEETGNEDPKPPSTGSAAQDFILDSQRAMTGQPTSRPRSGFPRFVLVGVGFLIFFVVVSLLDRGCAALIN
jgi:hypothetical protein